MDVTYLDHNASSPLPRPFLEEFVELTKLAVGSPSSQHAFGRQSRRLINEATQAVAKTIDCDPSAIIWTSGASEANSWVLNSITKKARSAGRTPRLILSSIEHDSILQAAKLLEAEGCQLAFIRAGQSGQVDLEHLKELLETPADLVAVMHSNNETGVLQPVAEAVRLAHEKGVPVLCDSVQSLGKAEVSARSVGADFMTFSGHKLGAPKGVGFLVAQGDQGLLAPVVYGKQQKGLRGGTENELGIIALSRVLKLYSTGHDELSRRLEYYHRRFESELKKAIPGTIVHGESSSRLPNTTFVGFEGVTKGGLVAALDLEGICASSGSACSSGTTQPSHVLKAMGCDDGLAKSSVRLSSGFETQWSDFERLLELLPKLVSRARGQN